jgi:hypothetical protein
LTSHQTLASPLFARGKERWQERRREAIWKKTEFAGHRSHDEKRQIFFKKIKNLI